MSYTCRFEPSRYEHLLATLTRLQDLGRNERLVVGPLDKDELMRTRQLIYDWLHHNGIKRSYRLRVEDDTLIIKRITPETPPMKVETMLSKKQEEYLGELLSTTKEEEVIRLMLPMPLNEEEKQSLLKKWKEIMT